MAIRISKLVRRGGFLVGSDGTNIWVSFKYERLPMFCHHCGLLGHDLKHCASYFAATKNNKEAPCQYGEWLKTTRGRQLAGRGKNFRVDPAVDGGQNSASQGVAMEEEHNHANPSEHMKKERVVI